MAHLVSDAQRQELVQLVSDLLIYMPDVGNVFDVPDSNLLEEIAGKLRLNIQAWKELPKAGCLCNPASPAPRKV